MAHTVRNKPRLQRRVARLRGQVEALGRSLEAEKGCGEVLHQIAAIRGAISGLMNEVLGDHIHEHVATASSEAARRRGAEELIDVLRTYLR